MPNTDSLLCWNDTHGTACAKRMLGILAVRDYLYSQGVVPAVLQRGV